MSFFETIFSIPILILWLAPLLALVVISFWVAFSNVMHSSIPLKRLKRGGHYRPRHQLRHSRSETQRHFHDDSLVG